MYQLAFRYPIGPSHKDSNFVSIVETCLRILLLPEAYILLVISDRSYKPQEVYSFVCL